MSNELIISATPEGCRIALLRDKSLAEFHEDTGGGKFSVGDIYLGNVKKVVQGLNAAFIDIGYEKDAFLHYLDLGPQFSSLQKFTKLVRSKKITGGRLDKFHAEKDINKHGKISQQLSKNQVVPVQVVKEPISTKGPRLSSELSIAGRYLVMVPFANSVNVSKRIGNSDERKRLQRLIQSIKPEGFGVIVRTVAEGKEVAELDKDLRNLVSMWEEGIARLAAANPREKLIGELSKTSSILRDVLNESFDNVHVDDRKIFEEVRAYIHNIAPEKDKIVKLYTGKAKIFEHYGIEKQIKSAFGQSVSLKGGGYLIIEHTEALHVIDVNSGNKSNREANQETTALSVNVEAAREVARQLRLRDMGGIIVVDFIDMRNAENKKLIFNTIIDEMEQDRAKHTVLPLSKFGLMQITRERVRPQVNIATKEVCPTCNGTGSITASILVTDQIEEHIQHLFEKQNEKHLVLALHPFLYAYYTKGFISKRVRMYFKYRRWVDLVKDSSLGITEFHFLNKDGEEIDLGKGEKDRSEETEIHSHPPSPMDQETRNERGQRREHEHKHEQRKDPEQQKDNEHKREQGPRREHDQRRNQQPRRDHGNRRDQGNRRDNEQRHDQRKDQERPQERHGQPVPPVAQDEKKEPEQPKIQQQEAIQPPRNEQETQTPPALPAQE